MKAAFISGDKCYRLCSDGLYRTSDGVIYEDGGQLPTTQTPIVKNYEHVAHVLPRWKPTSPGEKCPYPHVVPANGGKSFIGAFKSRREVNEYAAQNGLSWEGNRD